MERKKGLITLEALCMSFTALFCQLPNTLKLGASPPVDGNCRSSTVKQSQRHSLIGYRRNHERERERERERGGGGEGPTKTQLGMKHRQVNQKTQGSDT